MAEQFVNYSPLAPIELSANISSGATALALTGAGIGSLPSSGTYRFLIDGEEIVKVTAYSGGTATVVRGTEGTSAVAHNAGASVIPILTKAAMAQFATDVGGGGGGGGSYTQDCSAGGTIVYDGPSTVPPLVILTGTPGTSFDYELPDTSTFVVAIANEASQNVSVGNANNPAEWPILGQPFGNNGPQWFGSSLENGTVVLQPLTGWTPSGFPVNASDGTLVNFNDAIVGLSIWRLASYNVGLGLGQIQYVALYAMLNPKDLSTYGVTPPDMMGDPSTVVVPDGIALGYINLQGYVAEDVTGESTMLAHAMSYPNAPWNTQRAARNLCAPDYGDTLVGSSASGSYIMGLPNIGTGSSDATHHVKFVLQCRVVSTSGSTEAKGDMCTIIQECDYTTVAGSMVGIQGGAQTVTFLDQTSSGHIGTVVFYPLQSVSGSQISGYVQTPVGFHPSTVLDITLFTESYST